MNQRTRIKICGLTREADVDAAVDAGADAVGFVFHPASPRYVTRRARRASWRAPAAVRDAGRLFVNAPRADDRARRWRAIPTLVLQFHGDETPDAVRRRSAGPYLRAARMAPGFDLLDFARRFSEAKASCSTLMSRATAAAERSFDWSLVPAGVRSSARFVWWVACRKRRCRHPQLRPWAVDVSSGVESSRGIKDAAAIRRFCDAVREADARIAASTA